MKYYLQYGPCGAGKPISKQTDRKEFEHHVELFVWKCLDPRILSKFTIFGPSEWSLIDVQQCVFLFDAKPWFVVFCTIDGFLHEEALVTLRWFAIRFVCVAHNNHIIFTHLEWIAVQCAWNESYIGIATQCLIR